MRQMLELVHGFAPHDIVTLTDQAATRAAILRAIETHLIAPAAAGDIVFFFYAGHGSQVRNTRSDEADQLDESIVPADSRRGAPDIRDKELRRLFNRILGRGDRRSERPAIAVAKILKDGTALLQGGWANGLSVGSELTLPGDPRVRVTVTALVGLGQAEARVERGRVESGMLLESAGWIAAP